MRIDLDAARAARREAAGEAPVVVIDGKEYELPVEIPFEAAARMGSMAQAVEAKETDQLSEGFLEVLRSLFGPSFDEFMKSRPSVADLMELVSEVVKAYGFADLGESQASAG